MTAIEARLALTKVITWMVIIGGAVIGGFLLSANMFLLALFLGGILWMGTLPYHANLAMILCTVTYSSSLLLPFAPGRLTMFEASALLSFSGVVMAVLLRRNSPWAAVEIRRNAWMFIGLIAFAAVIVMIMRYRGVGFQLFGSGQTGGRRYFQQLECVFLPLLFAIMLPGEKLLLRLFYWQSALTTTHLVGESVLTNKFWFLLYFVDTPWDGINFAVSRLSGGIERYQSLQFVALAFITIVFVLFPVRALVSRRGLWLIPLLMVALAVGSMSGHRYLIYITGALGLVLAVTQRFLTPVRLVLFGALAVVFLGTAYAVGDRLPNAMQRTLYILPGFPANSVVRADADATFEGRKAVRQLAFDAARDYRKVGRGFTSASGNLSETADNLEMHLVMGIFYNGFLGLLVNTGLPGTAAAILYLLGGTWLSLRILRDIWRNGADDRFRRLSNVLAALWLANVVSFFFLEGSAEHVLQRFTLTAGMLIACEHNLRRRRMPAPVTVEEEEELPTAAPQPA